LTDLPGSLRFELPQGVDDDYLPLYGGKIIVKGTNGEQLSIPYGGKLEPLVTSGALSDERRCGI
jgi:hypothetical protein